MDNANLNQPERKNGLSSASGLDIIRTKQLSVAHTSKIDSFFDPEKVAVTENTRLSPLLANSILEMLNIPHLNDYFEHLTQELSREGGYNLSSNLFQTTLEEVAVTKKPGM